MALRAELAPGVVEKTAWKLTTSSRRFFSTLAVVVVGSTTLASLFAAVVTARNAAAVDAARGRGEQVASSMMDFREHLGDADGQVAHALVSGVEVSAHGRARYQAELTAAGRELTNAGVAARGGNADTITELAAALDTYARLVEEARSYPVDSIFHEQASGLVAQLVVQADSVRTSAEDDVEAAADEVTGLRTTLALAGLGLALATVLAAAVLVAGRTHLRLHPALVLAALALVAEVAVVSAGLWSQRDEMHEAANGEIEAYLDAHTAATTLFDMRSAQTTAVAAHGEPVTVRDGRTEKDPYDYVADKRGQVIDELDPAAGALADPETLPGSLAAYANSVAAVEDLDDEDAVETTLDGESAIAYRAARGVAVSTVGRTTEDLRQRLDDAAGVGVAWSIPILFGAVAAALAGSGVLLRGWGYL